MTKYYGWILILLVVFPWKAVHAETFDKPLSTKTVDLGRSPYVTDGRHAKSVCSTYAGFFVKEVDRLEKGAEKLAIVANPAKTPRPCRIDDGDEKSVDNKEWNGYFKGAKGGLVFFDADDGGNGGMGFAVYDAATGKKIFEDAAKGELDFLPGSDKPLTVQYQRVLKAPCSLPKDGAACWKKITAEIGVKEIAAPPCTKDYGDPTNPSVISYRVQTRLTPKIERSALGGAYSCWPQE